MKKEYHAPVVETEKIFDASAADISLLARCWGLTSYVGGYSHPDGGRCKE